MSSKNFSSWNGITRSVSWKEDYAKHLKDVFEAAKTAQWSRVLELMGEQTSLLHVVEPDEPSFNTLLHHAVLTNADMGVISQFAQEASLTRRNAHDQTALDLAREHHYEHLYQILEPEIKYDVSIDLARQLEQSFHTMIPKTVRGHIMDEYAFQLPQIPILLELDTPYGYFQIPGMYGGFRYWLKRENSDIVLLSHIASRVFGGSDVMHKMTNTGYELFAKGYEAEDLLGTELEEKLQPIKKD
jgi:hypothetical protein